MPNPPAMKARPCPFLARCMACGSAATLTLCDAEYNFLRERARAALHPEQAEMQKSLSKALDKVQEGIAATKRLLQERCQIVEHNQVQSSKATA